MAALKTLWGAVQWRWTPFFALVGGSILYALLVILIVPSDIGRTSISKVRETGSSVMQDESSPLTATVSRSPSPPKTRPQTYSPPERSPMLAPPTPAPMPPPEPRSDPAPVMEPPPPPPEPPPAPPPAPPPPAEPEPDEPDEEAEEEPEEQGTAPTPVQRSAIAGALRLLPKPAQPEADPEPEEEQ